MFCIFDLDGTVIDSTHRKATREDGTLDLEHWIENNTPEKIRQDSLLPMARMMRKHYYSGKTRVIVCTARVISDPDLWFFAENDLPFHDILSRPEGCQMRDGELKDILLRLYAQKQGISWRQFCIESYMYDDCDTVLTSMENIGLSVFDAKIINARLAA
jgi:FMN phosphatase YigB (HAD superfamily)